MSKKIDLYFSGLVRDASGTVGANVEKILDICDDKSVGIGKIFIAENGSKDDTRDILKALERDNSSIELQLFDDLDEEFPVREERIAHLRESLFNSIYKSTRSSLIDHSQLYIPIDLDSMIAQSINQSDFIEECKYVASGKTDAVFPVARPRYYDIYALRAKGWIETDCWKNVQKSRGLGRPLFPTVKYVYSNQKRLDELQQLDRISVESAFGGLGIYNLNSLGDASYKSNGKLPKNFCEHVSFNSDVRYKEISTNLVVKAPQEHIRYHTSLIDKLIILSRLSLINIRETISG
ncbi:hypothetical protein [Halorubrum salsamenti]|uniref:hypothetical protein n=1 Tax=Halorubrum salsamenti TaxID=2583990 RepID=UPI0011A206E6|nr:hypothetical protein [Halorubrum salsamenti]